VTTEQRSSVEGKATWEQLQDLWRVLLVEMLARVKAPKASSVELLQVARKFLRDNGCSAPDAAARKDLQDLYRLYGKALRASLSGPSPRSGVLAEARQWLTYHGIRPDLPAAHAAAVAKQLGQLDVPFTFTKQ